MVNSNGTVFKRLTLCGLLTASSPKWVFTLPLLSNPVKTSPLPYSQRLNLILHLQTHLQMKTPPPPQPPSEQNRSNQNLNLSNPSPENSTSVTRLERANSRPNRIISALQPPFPCSKSIYRSGGGGGHFSKMERGVSRKFKLKYLRRWHILDVDWSLWPSYSLRLINGWCNRSLFRDCIRDVAHVALGKIVTVIYICMCC